MGSELTCRLVRVTAGLVLGLSLVGCLKPIPRVTIPAADTSPPKMTWQFYSLQTKERRDVAQDGQTIDIPQTEQGVVTLAVEDLESGVKEVSLSGKVEFKCQQGTQVEEKKYDLESQNQRATPDHENKVPITASLVQSVDVNKHGCREFWTFAGGTISLVGKGSNFVNGTQTKTLKLNLRRG